MFAKRITDLRESKNLYQKDIARIFNVEQATVSNWEKGKRIPDSDMLVKLANFFGVSVDYLLGNIPKKSREEEIQILKNLLIECGYMSETEDLTDKELKKLLLFIKNNKSFLKGK